MKVWYFIGVNLISTNNSKKRRQLRWLNIITIILNFLKAFSLKVIFHTSIDFFRKFARKPKSQSCISKGLRLSFKKKQKQPSAVIQQQVFFLQWICSMLMVKNHQKYLTRCLAHKFSFADILKKDINHDYKTANIEKKSFWLFSLWWLWQLIPAINKWKQRCKLYMYRSVLQLLS